MSTTPSATPHKEQPRRSETDLGRVFPTGVRVDKVPYGLGVFAFAFIPKGTPIGRVSGTIISDPDYESDYCISAGENKVLEPGIPFCYLNHSCEPNCQFLQYVREDEAEEEELELGALSAEEMDLEEEDQLSYVDAQPMLEDDECFFGDGGATDISDSQADGSVENVQKESTDNDSDETEFDESEFDESEFDEPEMAFEDDQDAEIWVESLRDIMPGEELTIDYAWPADRAAQCLCGSPQCRGWIVDPIELHLIPAVLESRKL